MRRNISDKLPTLLPYINGIYTNPYDLLLSQNVSSATLVSYKSTLDIIRRCFNSYNLDTLFIFPEIKIKRLETIFGETYYYQKVMNVINKYLTLINNTSVKEIYKRELFNINEKLIENRKKNERRGIVSENWVDFKNIVKLKKKLQKEDRFQESLLLALYTEIPPVRNDYWNMKTKNYDLEKDNYYDGKKIVLNHYKTFNTYGRIIINVPDNIKKLYKMAKNDSEYLFLNDNGKPFKMASTFTKYLQNIFFNSFGTRTNFQMLRNIYLTHLAETRNNMTMKEMEQIAKIMGHSVQQGLLYRKFAT